MNADEMIGQPPRVLLAEDDAEMRDLIATVLRADGCEVIDAGDFDRLGEIVAQHGGDRESIAMIISDIRMPGLTGLEFLAALRCARWRTPVILITAFGTEEVHKAADQLGALAVLDKPFPLEHLRDLVRQAVVSC